MGAKQDVSFKGYKECVRSPIDDVMQQLDAYIGSCCTKIVSGVRDGLDGYDSIYDCFTCMRADRYIGDEGYFAENREDFSGLDSCPRGTLAGIRPDLSHSFITLVGGDRLCYRYFYPLSEVSAADAPTPSDTEAPALSGTDDSVEPFVTPFDFPAPAPMTDEAARFAQKFRVGSLIRYRRNLIAMQTSTSSSSRCRGVVAVVTEVNLDNGSVMLGEHAAALITCAGCLNTSTLKSATGSPLSFKISMLYCSCVLLCITAMVIKLKSSRHALKGCSPADQLAAFLVYFLSITKNKGPAVLLVLLFLGRY